MQSLLFSIVCLFVAAALVYSWSLRNFYRVRVGEAYRTRSNVPVRIVRQMRYASATVFYDAHGIGYYQDGRRVGSVHERDPGDLFRHEAPFPVFHLIRR